MEMLKSLRITTEILRITAAVDEFKGRWSAFGHLAPDRLEALRRVATIESIASSTRIEGSKLSDEEVEALLGGVEITSFATRDEQEVAGYARTMELVFESWREITLTENHIRQLHSELLVFAKKDARHRGQYKKLSNSVVARWPDGKQRVIFETASAFDTPGLMSELVAWTRGALESGREHPLLVIGAFVVRFLAIHPFQDGNGRLSRVLTTLLLLRAGYAYVPYSSLERVVEENKRDYYRCLRAAQGTLGKGEAKLGVWIEFFLRCLAAQKDALERRLSAERILANRSPLDEQLLGLARAHGHVTVRLAADATGINRNTIKARLRALARTGELVLTGEGRGAKYELTAER